MTIKSLLNDLESLTDFYKKHFRNFLKIAKENKSKMIKIGESFHIISKDMNRN